MARLEVRLLKEKIRTMETKLRPVVQSMSFNFMKTTPLKKAFLPKIPFKIQEKHWEDELIEFLEQRLVNFPWDYENQIG